MIEAFVLMALVPAALVGLIVLLVSCAFLFQLAVNVLDEIWIRMGWS